MKDKQWKSWTMEIWIMDGYEYTIYQIYYYHDDYDNDDTFLLFLLSHNNLLKKEMIKFYIHYIY